MSILGVVLRVQPSRADTVRERLRTLPGVDLVTDDGGARLVLVIEDTDAVDGAEPPASAAATLGAVTTWPEVLNASLVYEYSGPDAPAPDGPVPAYQAWRDPPGTRPRPRS